MKCRIVYNISHFLWTDCTENDIIPCIFCPKDKLRHKTLELLRLIGQFLACRRALLGGSGIGLHHTGDLIHTQSHLFALVRA